MSYDVIIQPPAQADIEEAYLYIRQDSADAAARWLDGLEAAIVSLAELPRRCPVAPESKEFDEQIRQLLYGRRRGVYRVLFVIRSQTVRVLHVRHGARRWLTTGEIES